MPGGRTTAAVHGQEIMPGAVGDMGRLNDPPPILPIRAYRNRSGRHPGIARVVGVGGGGGGAAGLDQPGLPGLAGQLGGVDQIAVVPQGNPGASRGVTKHRLSVLPCGGSGGGVAAVSDGDVAGHGGQGLLVEHLTHQAEILEHQHL